MRIKKTYLYKSETVLTEIEKINIDKDFKKLINFAKDERINLNYLTINFLLTFIDKDIEYITPEDTQNERK